jgi:hypothetical protein
MDVNCSNLLALGCLKDGIIITQPFEQILFEGAPSSGFTSNPLQSPLQDVHGTCLQVSYSIDSGQRESQTLVMKLVGCLYENHTIQNPKSMGDCFW